jgi:hypothetical protein
MFHSQLAIIKRTSCTGNRWPFLMLHFALQRCNILKYHVKIHNRPWTHYSQWSATKHSSTCHCIRFYTVCWMQWYRLQIKWDLKKKSRLFSCTHLLRVSVYLFVCWISLVLHSCSKYFEVWIPIHQQSCKGTEGSASINSERTVMHVSAAEYLN